MGVRALLGGGLLGIAVACALLLGGSLSGRANAANTAPGRARQPVTALSSTSSSIYWGARMDGDDTYGSAYGDAPWDSNTWNKFESDAHKKVSVLHWGVPPPWQREFNYFLSMHEKVRSRGDLELVSMSSASVRLHDIANGLYDSSLRTWAQQAAAWGHPFFLRFDWEMNGGWFAWGSSQPAADYVAAWRRFHNLADQAGASNITWVWCPNTEYPGSTPLEQLYPGDSYVDWTCVDAYNKGGTNWQSFSSVFGATYNHLLQIAPSKPIMIGETSSEESGGSKASWITDLLSTQLPTKFPQVKALVWFNWRIYSGSGWRPWQIESSASAQTAFASGIGSSYYAAGGGFGNLPLGSKIKAP